MDKVYNKKAVDKFIRDDLNKSVREEIHSTGLLDKVFKKVLKEAAERSDLDKKKTICKSHL